MKSSLFVIALFLTSTLAFADAKKAGSDIGKGITGSAGSYGMAGCGLGSFVFKENNSTQILAATTNGTSGSQTFGITFGTSNCGGAGALVMKNQVKDYVAANQSALQSEAAKGSGETLDGLASLMGVSNKTVFAANLQKNFQTVFSANSAEELTEKLFAVSAI